MPLPAPARALDAAAREAVDAALGTDAEAFAAAAARLAALDPEAVRLVLGAVLRTQLEDLHPDGIDGDDLRAALAGCLRRCAWCPDVDPAVLAVVLTGALGVHEDDPEGRHAPEPVARHAVLLVADLLGSAPGGFGPRLDAAWAELARTAEDQP